ncbi:MAG: M48 family metalloprotease [Methylococcales bacterium]|nr:M48 family metalloprotease [Methylococcales bacterium]
MNPSRSSISFVWMLATLKNPRRILAAIALGFGLLATFPSFGQNNISLPEIGDPSGALITPMQERALGEAFFRNLHGKLIINQDLEIQEYIVSLGERLSNNSDNPTQPFHFFVVVNPAINAFAGPGGYIGINAGLILATETESELASVIAHEIAHVTQRHLYRAFEAARRMTIPSAAALLASVLIGTQSAQLGQAAIIAAQAGSAQHRIDFTRDNEQEADRVGMQNLARSDFDPRGMPAFFEKLDRASRYYRDGLPEFLRTHPVTASRISDTRGRSEKFPYKQFLDSTEYLLTKAKLRVMAGSEPNGIIQYFESKLQRGTETQKAVSHYGYALGLAAVRQYERARPVLKDLIDKNPDESAFINALAGMEVESGNTSIGLRLYRKALEQSPGQQAIVLDYAWALVQAGQNKPADKLLADYLRNHQATPKIYRILSRAHGNQGHNAQAHRYLAEAFFLAGQTESAIKHVRIALKEASGHRYLTALIEERLDVFSREEEERKKKEK